MKTIEELINDLNEATFVSKDLSYYEKMVANIPDTEVIDRVAFILHKCTDKTVLDIGCVGFLHTNIKQVSKKCYGIDQVDLKDDPDFVKMRISEVPIPIYEVDILICGEVVEHLSNPGLFLDELSKSYAGKEKIFTVPNAFGHGHQHWVRNLRENTNKDHVAYYSYVTMSNLLQRHGHTIREFYWYDNPENSNPQGLNEGLVFVTT